MTNKVDDEVIVLAALNALKIFSYDEIINLINNPGFRNIITNPEEIQCLNLKKDMKEKVANQIKKVNINSLESRLEYYRTQNVTFIPINSPQYPQLLKKIDKPPLMIFARGKHIDFKKCFAIAGSRDISHHGHKMARQLGYELAHLGYTIVSGLARGTDTQAHCGALEAEGKTIAILADELSKIYPSENTKLSLDIENNGCLISQSLGLRAVQQADFVERNKITSGISEALLIIESSGEGGTHHQFKFGIEQERPTFLLKPVHNKLMATAQKYTSSGAILIDSIDDIVSFLTTKDSGKLEQVSLERFK